MGAKVAAGFSLVVIGVIIANIIVNPTGTMAAANGIATILRPTYNALLAQPS
jgi:hypothetical protein